MPGPAPKAQGKIQALAAFGRLRLLRAEHKLGPAAGYGRKRRQCLNFTLSLKFFAENKIEGGGAQRSILAPFKGAKIERRPLLFYFLRKICKCMAKAPGVSL